MKKISILGKKVNLIYICIIEVMILAAMTTVLLNQYRKRLEIEMPLADYQSGYVIYSGDGWYIDERFSEDNMEISYPIMFLSGPNTELPRGTYTVKIQYIAEADQGFRAGDSDFVQSSDAILSKNKTEVNYHITATEDIENFNISFFYNGQGLLGIQNVSIEKNTVGVRKTLFCMALLMVAFDGFLLLSTRSKEEKRIFWILGGIVMLSSLPVMQNAINCDTSQDMMFHLVRIEGISQEIRNGNIPVRLSSFWMDGYGYPVSVYYGDILLYIPAILRLIGFSITTSYIAYIYIINAGTTLLSYICFKRIFAGGGQNQNIAILSSMVYVTASYRLTNIYARGAAGEYSAMMFLPVIALAVYSIYMEDNSDRKVCRKNALILTGGITGLLESHILSTEMTVILLCLVCAILWRKTFTVNTLKVYILAVFETLLINMWFIIPFVDYFINVSVKTNHINPLINYQLTGVSITRLFSFDGTAGMLFTPGAGLMLVLIWAIGYIYHNKGQADKHVRFYTLLSVITLFIASSFFPWKHLVKNFKFMEIFAQVQFPSRYIGIADIFLSLLLGRLMVVFTKRDREKANRIIYFLGGICIVTTLNYTNGLANTSLSQLYDAAELDTSAVIGGEYMLASDGQQAEERRGLTGNIKADNMDQVFLLTRKGTEMCLYCKTADMEGTVEVPFFNYKGYHVYDENGEEIEVYNGDNFVIGFNVPANYDGKITVKFVEPWYWRVAEIISLVSLFIIMIRIGIAWVSVQQLEKMQNGDK